MQQVGNALRAAALFICALGVMFIVLNLRLGHGFYGVRIPRVFAQSAYAQKCPANTALWTGWQTTDPVSGQSLEWGCIDAHGDVMIGSTAYLARNSSLDDMLHNMPTGGTIKVPTGTITLSASVTMTVPVKIRCSGAAGGGLGTIFKYTRTTGSAITIDFGPGDQTGAGIYDCAFTGPGSTTSTTAIYVGGSSGSATGITLQNIHIGDSDRKFSDGFGTGVKFDKNYSGYIDTLINPVIEYTGTAVDATGEEVRVIGGNISNNTTSILLHGATDVTLVGTSVDTDSGVYVNNDSGIFRSVGGHYETNPVGLTSAGFIKTQGTGTSSFFGDEFCDDQISGTATAFFTFAGSGPQYLTLSGVMAYAAGQTVTQLVNPGPSAPGISATNVYATGSATGVPIFPGARAAPGVSYSSNGPSSGRVTLSGGLGSHTFSVVYTTWIKPVCTATDTTSVAAVKATITGSEGAWTGIRLRGTGSDVIAWTCLPARD